MKKDISLTGYSAKLHALLLESEVSGTAMTQASSLDEGTAMVITMLEEVRRGNHKVMVLGNGGSAAIAAHVQNDMGKAAGIRTLAFQDVSTLTAMANDHGYDEAYGRCVQQWAEPDDVLFCISSSGNSENMLEAVTRARSVGCGVITFSGFSQDNKLRQLGDINFYVPAEDYGYVETVHAMMTHYLTDMLIEI